MNKKILALTLAFLMLFSLASCFDRDSSKTDSINDATEEYEHLFYGRTGSTYDNYLKITPAVGTGGELDYNEIYINRTLTNGEQITRLPINTRVCVKYNGEVSTGEKPMINDTVSIEPSTFPAALGNNSFNIGLINEYFRFEKGTFDNALNAGKAAADEKRNLPVYLANSVKEFEDCFYANINDCVFDGEGNPVTVESVYRYVSGYDKEFFKNKSLILVFITWHTGSADFEITDLEKSGGAINISVKNLYSGATCDIGEWIFIVEVDKDYLRGVTDFNASINAPY